MYAGPPLPPGRPPETMAPEQHVVVVPAEFQAQQQALWRSGVQLRQHLRELVERAALLKAVAAELEAFESLGPKQNSVPAKDVEVLSTGDGLDERSVASLANVSGSESGGLVAAVQASGWDEAQSVRAASELQTSLLAPLEGTLDAKDGEVLAMVPNLDKHVSGSESGGLLSSAIQANGRDEGAASDLQTRLLDAKDCEVLAMVPSLDEHTVASESGGLVAAVQTSGRDEAQAVGAAVELQRRVTSLLAPLEGALGAPGGWEHAAAAARLRSKREKIQRNRKWRKRKRQRIAEARRKEQEGFEEADRKVDEWRAREIAKSIAQAKMEKMKVLAEQKAKEDRSRLAAELEMVLMVEKLQELRALRIQKLKKQGRFLPEEDDKFMERVRAAVEEEERQAAAAADTRAAAAAIASAAEAAKGTGQASTALKPDGDGPLEDQPEKLSEETSDVLMINSADQNVVEAPTTSSSAEEGKGTSVQEAYKLPAEFYHFYYGSQLDLGALIEVRRAWDAYLMPGGSRIPGHWIEPPSPADAVWASYLVRPTSKAEPKEKKKRRKK